METNYAVAFSKLTPQEKLQVDRIHRNAMLVMPETSERHVWEQCILKVYNERI